VCIYVHGPPVARDETFFTKGVLWAPALFYFMSYNGLAEATAVPESYPLVGSVGPPRGTSFAL
jgi:hypothetical protein